jgi:hypothetical protein
VDTFEQHVRAGLELAGVDVSDTDLSVMRAADSVYGAKMRALGAADLADVWVEPALDPSRPPADR